jgi:FkbM family methyltransferase
MSIQTKLSGFASSLRFDNWPQLLLDRIFFRNSRFVPHRLNGVDFVADQKGGDECGLRPCLVEGMYDPFLKLSGAFQKTRPLNIVDLGANAGGFSLIFAARGITVQKVASVEMNPLTYSRMRLNVLTAYGPKAAPINAAIGAASGTVAVPFSFGGTGEVVKRDGRGEGFQVPVVSVDEFMNANFPDEKVDILKMDIEGSEWDVIDARTCNRLRDCAAVIVEIHPRAGRGRPEFTAAMESLGFVLSDVRNPKEADLFCFLQRSS